MPTTTVIRALMMPCQIKLERKVNQEGQLTSALLYDSSKETQRLLRLMSVPVSATVSAVEPFISQYNSSEGGTCGPRPIWSGWAEPKNGEAGQMKPFGHRRRSFNPGSSLTFSSSARRRVK